MYMYTDVKAATRMSASVIWLKPLKMELEWAYERAKNTHLPTRCMVVVKALDNSITSPIEIPVGPPTYQAAPELRYGTTYSWKVVTFYGQNTQRETEEKEFTTPSEDEGL